MSIIIFDTETTGLQKADIIPLDQHPYIVEFAGIKIDEQTYEEIERFEFLCKPKISIPKEVVKVHGITDEKVKNEKPFSERMEELENFFADCNLAVAHNISYDKYMIDIEYKRENKTFKWPKKMLCTVNRTYSLFGYRLSLSRLYDYLFHETFEGAHRAMNDIEALKKCFVKLVTDKIIEL